ncbi:uncharacterized protein TOT_010000393 [Theileria orientalis strain Shintoku]|uniref:Uncharacterized protein n=1 Tax=Theileria orientalis strain Shintoku TaxID=869250 RepID=J4CC80_THEOR|nr:uncharacterized protein TOT_010000393 [Theileria orientalis strain Shintoku]PVC53508.1 hypothetical protein MACL_00003729 [Theileria orientalis]BAM38927.1 uncharacterized protein TOT_010000393 [Theileria orientalis strain Shintoku]|eukprot:XP_009689228.1 uncharacterized protein TOT_010000393 [Theileria orientalis strain Shintoku]
MNNFVTLFYKHIVLLSFVLYFLIETNCFLIGFHSFSARINNLKDNFSYSTSTNKLTHRNPFTLHSRTSIETVIHTDDYKNYDPNCIKYRKAKYWRQKSDEELQEEIRKIRKVLVKIEECIKIKDPSLLPDSKRNAKRTQAQLLFLLHERHLNSLRNSSKTGNKQNSQNHIK